MAVQVGIDLGSVSVNAALFTTDPDDVAVLEHVSAEARFRPVRSVTVRGGRPGWLSVAPYTRIAGNPLAQVETLIETIRRAANGSALGTIAGTGAGAAMIEREFGVARVSDFRCLTRAAEMLLPSVRTLFEIGGESSKYVRFDRHDPGGRLGIADYQTNGDCAAGTGAFLDQQAGRLRFRVEEIGGVVLATLRSAQIAGRCSVFAKSDMVHAQQRGFSPNEILCGLCEAVARNFRGAVTRGRPIVPDVGLVGGVAANGGVVRMLEAAFGWERGTLLVPDEHASFAAIGAAALAQEDGLEAPSPILVAVTAVDPLRQRPPAADRTAAVDGRRAAAARPPRRAASRAIREPVDAYLGIDIGSVSTNLVVIDAEARVLKEIYLRTDARPIEVVGAGLREIREAMGDRIRIRGVGTTGSGRDLIGELVGADTVNDEITAHKTGAAFIDRSTLGLGVDTIFEIGGQDAKYISLQDGVVVDFAMNDACAAGTGSFLEERARELGIRIEGEFAALALSSEAPIRLGERCTVFMERDVNAYLRRGAGLRDVVGGLAYSVVTNYINRVVRGRAIGDVIFFQGGTAYNDAVAAAFSAILGKRIVVPPFNGVIGALGAALARARDDESARRRQPIPRPRSRPAPARAGRVHLRRLHQRLPDAALHGGRRALVLGRQVRRSLPESRASGARADHRGPGGVPAVAAARRIRPCGRRRPGDRHPVLRLDLRLGALLVRRLPRARRAGSTLRADHQPDRTARPRGHRIRAVLSDHGGSRPHPVAARPRRRLRLRPQQHRGAG